MRLDFTGQTVLVTGATRGIGRQIANDLAAAGASLILTGASEATVEALRTRSGDRHRCLRVDFSDRANTAAFLDQLRGLERLDACINNAGINRIADVASVDDADWDAVLDVNLRAPMAVTRAIAPGMRRRRYGRIVNVGSIWGHIGWTRRTTYAATKFGIRGLTVAAANDLAADNILVNAVAPGFTLTDMVQRNYSDDERRAIEATIPLGRMATPADISPAVLFLASSANTYITGQSLIVDGGYVIA